MDTKRIHFYCILAGTTDPQRNTEKEYAESEGKKECNDGRS